MNREAWRRVEQIFSEVASLPASEREPALERLCGGEAELRDEVGGLLAFDQGPEGVGEVHAILGAAAVELGLAETPIGTVMGRYQILSEIGRGGMGAVYLAARVDKEFEKRAAIKVIKRGFDSDAVLARFRQERQILAQLDHPYIAKLLDGGTSEDGRPYFVMEFVDGVPVDEYCESHKLTQKQRCALFLKLAEAIIHAHRNLVIHRDLKPSNILVTEDGIPKLLDFGISRLLTAASGKAAELTMTGAPALTPDYASPEQLRGEAVNTATDIYSLGAVLFELLTGKRARPDEPVSKAALPAELRTVVGKAMRMEPERRYSSVEEFRRDVERYLDGEPVAAHSEAFSYRAKKLIARHQVVSALVGLIVLLVFGSLIAIGMAARREELARGRAELRLVELLDLSDKEVVGLEESLSRLPGSTEPVRHVVNSMLEYLNRVSKEGDRDVRVQAALASAYANAADVEGYPHAPNLGDLNGAKKNYEKALGILQPLVEQDPTNADFNERLAAAARHLGDVEIALGQEDEAVTTLRRGVEASERAGQDAARRVSSLKGIADGHHSIAMALIYRDLKAAEKENEEERAAAAKLMESSKPDDESYVLAADSYALAGMIQGRQSNIEGALNFQKKGAAIRERLVAENPTDVMNRRNLMMSYGHIGDNLGSPFIESLGNEEAAAEYYRKAVGIASELNAEDGANRLAMQDLGVSLSRLGSVMNKPRQLDESVGYLKKSVELLTALTAESPHSATYRTQLALALELLGQKNDAQQNYGEAVREFQRSAALCDEVLAENARSAPAIAQRLASSESMMRSLGHMGEREEALRVEGEASGLAKRRAALAKNERTNAAGVIFQLAEGRMYLALSRSGRGKADDKRKACGYFAGARDGFRELPGAALVQYRKQMAEAETQAGSLCGAHSVSGNAQPF